MSRTWRTERSTPKKHPLKAPVRPRMEEFSRDYYQGKGYKVELPQEDTVTSGLHDDTQTGDARGYLEADYG